MMPLLKSGVLTARNQTIQEAVIENKDFYLSMSDEGLFSLKTNHVYWHQIQGQLHVARRQKYFFIVWTIKQCVILIIKKDISWAINIDKLEDFFKNIYLPFLLANYQ